MRKFQDSGHKMPSVFYEHGQGNRFEITTKIVADRDNAPFYLSEVVRYGKTLASLTASSDAESVAYCIKWLITHMPYAVIDGDVKIELDTDADGMYFGRIKLVGEYVGTGESRIWPDDAIATARAMVG